MVTEDQLLSVMTGTLEEEASGGMGLNLSSRG
jgi:hypothetical protein